MYAGRNHCRKLLSCGHLGLDNLILIYDDNHITIDGDTAVSFTEDVAKRFEAYNWYVQVVDGDGNDMKALRKHYKRLKKKKVDLRSLN